MWLSVILRLKSLLQPRWHIWKWIWNCVNSTRTDSNGDQGQVKSFHQRFSWLEYPRSDSCRLLEYYWVCALRSKEKITKEENIFGKEGRKPLSRTVRAEHTEGEGKGLELCHSDVTAAWTFGGWTGTLFICITDLWKRHLLMEWKASLKVRIQLSSWDCYLEDRYILTSPPPSQPN